MNPNFSQMSVPPSGTPPPGYGGPPPGYGMAPPPKKNNTATVIIIVLAAVFGGGIFVVAILAAILFPVFAKVRSNARLATCESNVKQIELGLIQYVQDNNKYPPSAAAYKDALARYIVNGDVYRCPADTEGGEAYSLNQNLQGVSLDKVRNPDQVVAIYEGKHQRPDFRHDGRAVVGFADGHVRTFRAEQAQDLQWQP